MNSHRGRLLSTTVIPLAIGMGAVVAYASTANSTQTINPAAVSRPAIAGNPAAVPRPSGPTLLLAKGCNPCAAKKGCGPCAAKGCGPCAAKKGCNPCAAKGCNPCAAKGCNPCAAKGCGPCAAGAGASSECVVPRLAKANPCAAKKGCSPCSPCGAKKGCGPCAAKKGCNPCAAKKGCNPCNPCAASEAAELTPCEAKKAYDCMKGSLRAAYAKSGNKIAKAYGTWKSYNKTAYVSDTHGGRYVNNFANRKGVKYGKYEKAGRMPRGAILAKDSFAASPTGQLSPGPLFIMRKMGKGFNMASGDWRYSMIMPNGSSFGVTGGKGSNNVKFCYECHINADVDSMFFLPEEVRK